MQVGRIGKRARCTKIGVSSIRSWSYRLHSLERLDGIVPSGRDVPATLRNSNRFDTREKVVSSETSGALVESK